jgi:hypothetical protein
MGEGFANFWRALSWPKLVGETFVIVIGVFLGIQASNWNDARIERAGNVRMLRELKPELNNLVASFTTLTDYYVVTRKYADTAFAGWRGDPGVSDRDFVIAAYQASQNTFSGMNNGSWSEIFGSDQLRSLDDQKLRDELASLMTTDFAVLEKELFTDYRQHVRQVIPEDIQDAIRAQCGDQRVGDLGYIRLPSTCTVDLPDDRFAVAAKELRGHLELVGEMRWHFAAVASYVDNIENLATISRRVLKRIETV